MDNGVGSDLALEGGARSATWPSPRFLRRLVNLWLIFHLAAIVIAPSVVPPSSELVRETWGWFQPYIELLYLDHGYHFFAPEPGESTLLRYEAQRADGTVVHGRIPDRATKPRLLYHRYFMLTEHMNDAPESLQRVWYDSYAQHIGRKSGAAQVTLFRQTHNLPTMERVRDGGRLTDPESYEEQSLGTFPCEGY